MAKVKVDGIVSDVTLILDCNDESAIRRVVEVINSTGRKYKVSGNFRQFVFGPIKISSLREIIAEIEAIE